MRDWFMGCSHRSPLCSSFLCLCQSFVPMVFEKSSKQWRPGGCPLLAGSAQRPLPPQPSALTVSIKAQQPVDKLARPAECTVHCAESGPGRFPLCRVWVTRREQGVRWRHRQLISLQEELGEQVRGRGSRPPVTTFGLGEEWHFVLVPLIQLRAAPQIITENLSQPGKCQKQPFLILFVFY